jgi:hypothetical protein
MLWEDDTFGRWVQFFCAVPLLLIAGGCVYVAVISTHSPYSIYSRKNPVFAAISGAALCLCLAGRCLWYAITGNNNINRDDF